MGQNICKITITYEKGEPIRFISHLDHIRLLERAIRRADLPIVYSQGFNPRMKISYLTRALKVGEASTECRAEMTFEGWTKPEIIMEKLNAVAPEGFKILSASFS